MILVIIGVVVAWFGVLNSTPGVFNGASLLIAIGAVCVIAGPIRGIPHVRR